MKLLILGDNNVQERDKPELAYARLSETLQEADLRIAHMEGLLYPPSQDLDQPDIEYKRGWRHSDPSQVEAYIAAGFDILCCASNVSYGGDAIVNTVKILDEREIPHAGIGIDKTAARKPAVVEQNGFSVGLLSYGSVFWPIGHAAAPGSPGIATIKAYTGYVPGRRALEMPGAAPEIRTWPDQTELAEMVEDVEQLREQVDLVVVSCHWGVSSSRTIADYQQTIAHGAIDAGADIVMGHHPHVVQSVEVYQGKPIFYSLGNAAFDWQLMRSKHFDGLMVRCEINGRDISAVRLLPIRRDDENCIAPAPADTPEGKRIADSVIDLSCTEHRTVLRIEAGEIVVL